MAVTNDNKKIAKPAYTLDKLQADICAQYDAENKSDGEDKMRDKLLKLRVLQHLINIASIVADYKEQEDICDRIKLELTKIDALFGYTCFMASNSQFDYSWNYQRKQWDNYVNVLGNISVFILRLVSWINKLQIDYLEYADFNFIFANIFVVSLDAPTGTAKVNAIWGNIEQLFSIERGCSISANIEQVIVLSTFCRFKENDMEAFLEKLQQIEVKHKEES